MAIYDVYMKPRSGKSRFIKSGYLYDSDTKQFYPATQPAPTPTPEPEPTPTNIDKFGIKMLNPTFPAGREFYQPTISGVKNFGYRNGDLIVRGDGSINGLGDVIVMKGNAPRVYVYDTNRQKKWKNVEVTVHVMRVSETRAESSLPKHPKTALLCLDYRSSFISFDRLDLL